MERPRNTTLLCVLAASLVAAMTLAAFVAAQSPELIVDLLTTPNKYWNKTVVVKGHVRTVAANPPGTNRGSYVLRDSSDCDITVLTSELPAQGREYTVTGVVEQINPDQRVPCVREYNRRLGTEIAAQAQPRPAPRSEARTERSVERPQPPPQQQAPTVVVIPQPAPHPEPSGIPQSYLMYGLVAAVAVLAVVLVVLLRPKPAPVAAAPAPLPVQPQPVAPTAPRMSQAAPIVPPPAPPSKAMPAATQGMATRPLGVPSAGPAASGAKATEMFLDLGAELVVTEGPDRGRHYNLTKPMVTMGRAGARQNEVTLSDNTVSREHAKIVYSMADKSFRLINESTTNPVRLNGNPVDSSPVQDNDIIQLGSTTLKFKKI